MRSCDRRCEDRARRELAREMPTWVTLSATTPVTASDGGSELEKHHPLQTNTTSLPRSHTKAIISAREWSLEGLLAQGARFKAVPRVSALSEPQMLEAIRKHEEEGEPLIIEHWDKHDKWPGKLFSADWLLAHKGDESKPATCRNGAPYSPSFQCGASTMLRTALTRTCACPTLLSIHVTERTDLRRKVTISNTRHATEFNS